MGTVVVRPPAEGGDSVYKRKSAFVLAAKNIEPRKEKEVDTKAMMAKGMRTIPTERTSCRRYL